MRLKTLIVALICLPLHLAAYTTVYNGIEYSSAKPHNLNVFYFKAADVALDGNHRKRISAMMLWLQQYYGQQMAASSYGNKTFGLYRNAAPGQHPTGADRRRAEPECLQKQRQ